MPPTPKTERLQFVEDLCEGLIGHFPAESGGRMILYIDEGTDFMDAHQIGEWFEAMFRKARKRDISLVVATQRPQGINKWAENNATHELIFFVRPFDRRYLDKLWPGLSADIARIPYRPSPESWTDPKLGLTDKPCFMYVGPSGEVVPYLQP